MKKTRATRSPSAPPLPAWIEASASGTIIKVLAVPRASRTEITGIHGEPPRLRLRVAAPPVDGEANAEIVRFLASELGLPKSSIRVLRGESGKRKDLLAEGADPAAVLARIAVSE